MCMCVCVHKAQILHDIKTGGKNKLSNETNFMQINFIGRGERERESDFRSPDTSEPNLTKGKMKSHFYPHIGWILNTLYKIGRVFF